MRQVKYTRPPDWVDPFQVPSSEDKLRPVTHPVRPALLGIITEDKSQDDEHSTPLPTVASSRSLDSPLTFRSTGSVASQASRASISARGGGGGRPPKIKELRKSHLDQLNRSHTSTSLLIPGGTGAGSGAGGDHHRYTKRSISSHSLKSDSVGSECQRSEPPTRPRGPFSKPPSRLLATCQRAIVVQRPPEPLPSLTPGQRPRTTSEISCDSDHSSYSSSSHARTLPPIRASLYHELSSEPPPKTLLPSQVDVTIMCSIVSTIPPPASRSSSSLLQQTAPPSSADTLCSASDPSITFTSGTIEISFPLAHSYLYVTVDGVYDTSIHCDAQIPLDEFLNHQLEGVEDQKQDKGGGGGGGGDDDDVSVSSAVSCGRGGGKGGVDDDTTADLTITTARSSIVSNTSLSSHPISRLEIEEISRDIVHQITLHYDATGGDYAIVLPDEGGETPFSDENSSSEIMNAMTEEEASKVLNGECHLFSINLSLLTL
jgi:hypothetical protein